MTATDWLTLGAIVLAPSALAFGLAAWLTWLSPPR